MIGLSKYVVPLLLVARMIQSNVVLNEVDVEHMNNRLNRRPLRSSVTSEDADTKSLRYLSKSMAPKANTPKGKKGGTAKGGRRQRSMTMHNSGNNRRKNNGGNSNGKDSTSNESVFGRAPLNGMMMGGKGKNSGNNGNDGSVFTRPTNR